MARSDSNESRFSTGLGTKQLKYDQPASLPQGHEQAFADLSRNFTGADIKAIIIRRDSDVLLKRAKDYLDTVQVQANIDPVLNPQTALEGPQGQDQPYDQSNLIPVLNLEAVTVSTFRTKRQVRALGHVNPRGIARGNRTIGGTIIMTEFDRDTFWNLISIPNPVNGEDINIGDSGAAVLPDQLAPFDLLLMFANEAGIMAYRIIYEIEIVTNGVVYSIQDMFSENTLSFLCTDVTPLIPLAPLFALPGGYMSDKLIGDVHTKGAPVHISPLAQVSSGKEVLKRFRMLKQSRDTNR